MLGDKIISSRFLVRTTILHTGHVAQILCKCPDQSSTATLRAWKTQLKSSKLCWTNSILQNIISSFNPLPQVHSREESHGTRFTGGKLNPPRTLFNPLPDSCPMAAMRMGLVCMFSSAFCMNLLFDYFQLMVLKGILQIYAKYNVNSRNVRHRNSTNFPRIIFSLSLSTEWLKTLA